MKRRLNIRYDTADERKERFNDLRKKLRASIQGAGEVSEDTFLRIMEALEKTGINEDMMLSVAKQSGDHTKADLQVFTLHNEHVLDQLALQQGVYTDHVDTATHPNFAIRFPAETELIFRRMTLGDTLLLQATMSAEVPSTPASNSFYWKRIWAELIHLVMRSELTNDQQIAIDSLLNDGQSAFATACDFALTTDGLENITNGQLITTFMNERSRFYSNVKASKERIRSFNSNKYKTQWRFQHVEEVDSLFMGACMIMLYGMDNYARLLQQPESSTKINRAMLCRFDVYFVKHGIADYFELLAGVDYGTHRPDPYANRDDDIPPRSNQPRDSILGDAATQAINEATLTITRVAPPLDDEPVPPTVPVSRLLP